VLDVLTKITEIENVETTTLESTLWALGYTAVHGGPDAVAKSKTVLAKLVSDADIGVRTRATADYTK
jgi:hypothetical protein